MVRYRDLFLQRQQHMLSHYLYASGHDAGLLRALRYMLDAPGKLIRAMFLYAVGESMGLSINQLHHPAIALEWLHLFSLVHDDLPAMDDDIWRRGQRSCHAAFDESTAILVGDALHAMVYECLTDPISPISYRHQCQMVQWFARVSGPQGLMLGDKVMRVVFSRVGPQYTFNNYLSINSCGTYEYGETEDFVINFTSCNTFVIDF